jgi:hypothetical protein
MECRNYQSSFAPPVGRVLNPNMDSGCRPGEVIYLCGVEGGMSGQTPSARGEVKAAPLLHFHTARVFFMPEGS